MGAAFTGLHLLHKFPFDPTGDGFPSCGSWMSRDRGGGNRVPFCSPHPTSPSPSPTHSVKISLSEGAFLCHCDAAWDGANGNRIL